MERRKKIQKLNNLHNEFREVNAKMASLVNPYLEGTRLLSAKEKYLLNEINRLEKELYEDRGTKERQR